MERFYFLPVDPISVNRAYIRNFGRGRDRRLSKEAESLKLSVKSNMEMQDETFYDGCKMFLDKDEWLHCDYAFLLPKDKFYSDKKFEKVRKEDLTNFYKLVEDAMSEYTGIDDSKVVSMTGIKGMSDFLPLYRHVDKPVVILHLISRDSISELSGLFDVFRADGKERIEFINSLYDIKL